MRARPAPLPATRPIFLLAVLLAAALVMAERPAAAAGASCPVTKQRTAKRTPAKGQSQTNPPLRRRKGTTAAKSTKRKKPGYIEGRRRSAKAQRTRMRNKIIKSMGAHERVAMRLAETAMMKELGGDYMMTSIKKFPGDKTNPITGDGLYVLTVHDTKSHGVGATVKRGLLGESVRRVFVQIDTEAVDGLGADFDALGAEFGEIGKAGQVAGSDPFTTGHRTLHRLNEALPVRELVSDFAKSRGKWLGLAELAGATGLAVVGDGWTKYIGLTVIQDGLRRVGQGVGRRKAAREAAFSETVKDIRTSLSKEPGKRWTLAEAYGHYKQTLENTNSETLSGKGTTPMDMMTFARRLAANNL